jgi:hypothetical protein
MFGVPQGSGISPLLFVIFTACMPEICNEGKLILYADDTTIIALGRLSPAKAADTIFTLIRPELYCPDSQSHLAAQSANSCNWVSFCLPAPARGRQKNWGNILTMPANWAEKNAAYKLIISIKKYLTAIILN